MNQNIFYLKTDSKVRLCTLELTIKLLQQLVYTPNKSYLQDRHLACIEAARECSAQILRNFYKVGGVPYNISILYGFCHHTCV